MAKTKNPLLSLSARGPLGSITYRRKTGAIVAEKTPTILDVKSPGQLSWRHMYQKAISLWSALSASEKQEWESLARPKHMTGFAWFISQALKPNPGLYLPLQGGIMQGDIDMASHAITNLPDPTANQDAATRKWVLDQITAIPPSDYSFLRFRKNARYHSASPSDSYGGTTFSANTIYAVPIFMPVAKIVTRIACYLRSGEGAGRAARLGIYADNGNISPDALIQDCGEVDLSTTGMKSIQGLTIPLLSISYYWLAIAINNSSSILTYDSPSFNLRGIIGMPSNDIDEYPHSMCYRSYSYAALPNPFGTPTFNGTYAPRVAVYWN